MTAPINLQHNQLVPDRGKPVLKTVNNPSSKGVNTVQSTIRSIENTQVQKSNSSSSVDKTNEPNKKQQAPEQSIDKAVEQINSYVQSVNRNLAFKVDNESGETVVKITDSETNELIRQIPNEEALRIARQLDGQIQLNEEHIEPGLLLIKLKA